MNSRPLCTEKKRPPVQNVTVRNFNPSSRYSPSLEKVHRSQRPLSRLDLAAVAAIPAVPEPARSATSTSAVSSTRSPQTGNGPPFHGYFHHPDRVTRVTYLHHSPQ